MNPTAGSAGPLVLRVGCPMWAHPPWIGTYLSPGNRGCELSEYARWCNAVEGNTTFYAEPSASTVERWCEQAPPDFRFVFKLPRTITHERRLRSTGDLITSFLRRIEPLGERIGALQIQLPPSFGPESTTALRGFVGTLPSDHDWVVEFRHPGYFDGGPAHAAVDELLGGAGVGRVVLDTRPLYDSAPSTEAAVEERRTKPRLPVLTEQVGETPVVRVIGQDSVDGTMDGLRQWVPIVGSWLREGRRPFLFVHQPENLHSPRLARLVHDEVAAHVEGLTPLPEPLPVAPRSEVTGQDSLF